LIGGAKQLNNGDIRVQWFRRYPTKQRIKCCIY